MNMKRVAAIIGLIGMAISILCIVISGMFPALKDLLWTTSLIAFLIAASISLFFYFRKKEEEEAKADKEDQEQ